MFVQLHDSDQIKSHLPFYVNVYLIETIMVNEDLGKIKIFSPSGKEWISDLKYLNDLLKFSEKN